MSAIVRELHLRGPLSRSELVAWTGLTRSAIRSLVGDLATGDFVVEDVAVRLGTPGRPSPQVRLVAENTVVLAFEIAVDSLAVAVVGLGGHVHWQERVDRSRAHSTVDDIVADLTDLADRARQARPFGEVPIGVGVAVAGLVRQPDGLVAVGPNLGWIDAPLGQPLAAALGLPVPIAVANEADLGALAEIRRGAARGAANVLYVHGEVGVGGGIIVDGRPLTGGAGFAGEIGHMSVNPDGRPCRCGSTGCWETEVGEVALLERADYPPDGGRMAVSGLLADALDGRPEAIRAFTATGRWLGIGLASLVNVLNPNIVVLGGLFSRAFPFLEAEMLAAFEVRALSASRATMEIVASSLGIDAPLIGAAELAFEPLLVDPVAWLGPRAANVVPDPLLIST
ncbi:MAG: ROK family protein [Chloroflexota bacterium]